jgi:hypothetical protein
VRVSKLVVKEILAFPVPDSLDTDWHAGYREVKT